MTDYTELKRLVDRVLTDRRFCGDENHKALADGVRALIAENDRLESERAELWRGKRDVEATRDTKSAVIAELKAENEALRKELPGIRPFKPYQDSPVIGFTGCVICGVYTDHEGLPCPKTRATADAALGQGEQS